jgi:hypothetical protein
VVSNTVVTFLKVMYNWKNECSAVNSKGMNICTLFLKLTTVEESLFIVTFLLDLLYLMRTSYENNLLRGLYYKTFMAVIVVVS